MGRNCIFVGAHDHTLCEVADQRARTIWTCEMGCVLDHRPVNDTCETHRCPVEKKVEKRVRS